MNVLAIETSCDETAISIVKTTQSSSNLNFQVLSDLVMSQIDIHVEYGGVFPAVAKREHAKNLVPILIRNLKESNIYTETQNQITNLDEIQKILEREPELFEQLSSLLQTIEKPDIETIAVTVGPGLAPALWVGVNFARALSAAWNISVIPVNHMEGHIASILLKNNFRDEKNALLNFKDFTFPVIALLISGGHTQLVLVRDWSNYEILGETIDDAVGEAFDKVARMLGMEYPGGPKISQAAKQGIENEHIKLPRPMINSKDYRFSFSGLKTAARYLIQDLENQNKLSEQTIADIAWEFEHAVTEVLTRKTLNAIEEHNAKGLIIAGGVSANKHITESFTEILTQYNIPLYLPEKTLTGDNSIMIAAAGLLNQWNKKRTALIPGEELKAVGNLKISS